MTPRFLARLGLGAEADERAIRRAYARELKLIDQDADPAAFQTLREAYEVAMDWARRQATAAASAARSAHHAPAADGADPRPPAGGATESSRGLDTAQLTWAQATSYSDQVDYGDRTTRVDPVIRLAPLAHPGRAQQVDARTGTHHVPAGAGGSGAESAQAASHTMAHSGSSAPGSPKHTGQPLPTPYAVAVDLMNELLATLAHAPELEPSTAHVRWKNALRATLQDERLVSLEVRQQFEHVVLEYLHSPWQPSHPLVLHAAADVFDWEGDRARLRVFGYLGASVDLALHQRFLLASSASGEAELQRRALDYLRLPESPNLQDLALLFPRLVTLRRLAPSYAKLVINPRREAEWKAAYEAADLRHPLISGPFENWSPPPGDPAAPAKPARWQVLLVILIAVGMLFAILDSNERRQPSPAQQRLAVDHPVKAPFKAQDIADKLLPPRSRPAPLPGKPLSGAQLDEIGKRIAYQPKLLKDSLHVEVEYKVQLSADGKVHTLVLTKPSADPAFDAAVGRAIRESKSFDDSIVRAFTLSFSNTFSQPPPPKPAPRLSKEEQDELPKRVVFPYEADDLKWATYRFQLDEAGKLRAVDRLKSSGNPAFDTSVENAIRSMEPFKSGHSGTFTMSFGPKPRSQGQRQDANGGDVPPSAPPPPATAPDSATVN